VGGWGGQAKTRESTGTWGLTSDGAMPRGIVTSSKNLPRRPLRKEHGTGESKLGGVLGGVVGLEGIGRIQGFAVLACATAAGCGSVREEVGRDPASSYHAC
jgi:uncharacterized protein YcfJ